VKQTLVEQADGWQDRPLFERQWVIRDFRKAAGMPVEQWVDALRQLEEALDSHSRASIAPITQLASYYTHLAELAKGYEKDQAKLSEYLKVIDGWITDIRCLETLLAG
jgi:hypothetical protein